MAHHHLSPLLLTLAIGASGLMPLGAAEPPATPPVADQAAERVVWSGAGILEVPVVVQGGKPWALSLAVEVIAAGSAKKPVTAGTHDLVLDIAGAGMAPVAIPVTWSGRRQLVLPLSALPERTDEAKPLRKLTLSLRGGSAADRTFTVSRVAVWGDIQGQASSPETILAAMQTARIPGLAETADPAGRNAAVARYFRRRTSTWQFEPTGTDAESDGGASKRVADRILAGRMRINNRDQPLPMRGGQVDFRANPTIGTKQQTFEYGWSLNRMVWWTDLVLSYRATKEERYATALLDQVRSWIDLCPMPAIRWEEGGSTWRGLECGLRAGRMIPNAFFGLLASPACEDRDVVAMLGMILEHGEYLAHEARTTKDGVGGNHFVIAMIGLYTLGASFPEFTASGTWRHLAYDRLSRYLVQGTLPDGAWYEVTPGYHQWIVNLAARMVDMAQQTGNTQDITPEFRRHLERMAEWNLHLLGPDGTVSPTNDSGTQHLTGLGNPLLRSIFPDNDLLAWAAAGSMAKAPPARLPVSEQLAGSGYAVLRTGWGPEESCAILDAGPKGGWHGHMDALNLIYWGRGRQLLFDGTGGVYGKSANRAFTTTTAAHNCLLVDGQDQCRTYDSVTDPAGMPSPGTPGPVVTTGPGWSYACGWYQDAYEGADGKPWKPVRHRREVVQLASHSLVVVDTILPNDPARTATYEILWQVNSTRWSDAAATRTILTTDPDQANLAITPLADLGAMSTHSAEETPRRLGWKIEKDDQATPTLAVVHAQTGTGVRRFVTLLQAVPAGQTGAVTAVRPTAPGSWQVQRAGGGALTITVAQDQPERRGGITISDGATVATVAQE